MLVCLFTSQESTPLSPQCSLKVGQLLQLIFQQSVCACVCVSSVCPEISHRNFLITQKQAVFWASVVPTTRLCLALDFNSHTLALRHTHTKPCALRDACTHTQGTPDYLKNETVFRTSRYKALVRKSNCLCEIKPMIVHTLCPEYQLNYNYDSYWLFPDFTAPHFRGIIILSLTNFYICLAWVVHFK